MLCNARVLQNGGVDNIYWTIPEIYTNRWGVKDMALEGVLQKEHVEIQG